MVRDLIDAESKEWKVDVVRQNFLSQDVEAILSIPLCVNGAWDKLVLAENKNGRFSVKSAYKVVMEDGLFGGRSSYSSQSELRKVKKGLWGMNVPNKVKHFAWKACRNILAIKENLRKRKITSNDICDCCGTHIETERTTLPEKWNPLAQGCYKVNVDGAMFNKRKQTGIGVVIRDDVGEVIAAMSKRMAVPLGALETEAKAMETAVCFAVDVGIRDVIFEGDSLLIYNALHDLGLSPAAI
ncbi:uncharacterized protein LOC142609178 [Castanea sativa]|uniref:uncharacterized protein LOC142609178 n=1 Tax=Castanea sativa TaxID=21020 RepID=UPI003F64A85E